MTDAAQEARRAAMGVHFTEKPEHYIEMAWADLGVGLLGRGNRPDICLSNAVANVRKALELGLPAQDLDIINNRPVTRGLPEEEPLRRVWLATATAIEAEALSQYHAKVDEAQVLQNSAIVALDEA